MPTKPRDDTNTDNEGADDDDRDQGTATMKARQTRTMGTGRLARPSRRCVQLLAGWWGGEGKRNEGNETLGRRADDDDD